MCVSARAASRRRCTAPNDFFFFASRLQFFLPVPNPRTSCEAAFFPATGLWAKFLLHPHFLVHMCVCILLLFLPIASSELADTYEGLSQAVPDASDMPDEPPKLGAWMMARNVAEIAYEGYKSGLWGLFTVSECCLACL